MDSFICTWRSLLVDSVDGGREWRGICFILWQLKHCTQKENGSFVALLAEQKWRRRKMDWTATLRHHLEELTNWIGIPTANKGYSICRSFQDSWILIELSYSDRYIIVQIIQEWDHDRLINQDHLSMEGPGSGLIVSHSHHQFQLRLINSCIFIIIPHEEMKYNTTI